MFRSEKPTRSSSKPRRPISSRRKDEIFIDDERAMEEIIGLSRQQEPMKKKQLAEQFNAIVVLDMIRKLQEEIEVNLGFK
jgi:predicted transposase YdaD